MPRIVKVKSKPKLHRSKSFVQVSKRKALSLNEQDNLFMFRSSLCGTKQVKSLQLLNGLDASPLWS